MKLYTVWSVEHCEDKEAAKRTGLGIGIDEKCLLRKDGNYVGLRTGKIYSKDTHYHSANLEGIITSVDSANRTGMYHLDKGWNSNTDENRASFKKKYVGCYVTLQKAHKFNEAQIYRCIELDEYFSESEVEILSPAIIDECHDS